MAFHKLVRFSQILSSAKIPSLMLGIFCLSLVVLSKTFLQLDLSERKRNLISPPPMLVHFSFGFNEIFSDLLWIRAIQDFDYCDKPIQKNICSGNSWLYNMLDSATELSPNFRAVFLNGPLALSIIISDIEGASKLFDKSVKAYPNDWKILYNAAYHVIYEEKNKKKAAELLINAGKNGAPAWVFSLANRLYVDSGNTDLAEKLLSEMIESQMDPLLVERMKEKLNHLKDEKKDPKSKI